jgi:hypothetical protein
LAPSGTERGEAAGRSRSLVAAICLSCRRIHDPASVLTWLMMQWKPGLDIPLPSWPLPARTGGAGFSHRPGQIPSWPDTRVYADNKLDLKSLATWEARFHGSLCLCFNLFNVKAPHLPYPFVCINCPEHDLLCHEDVCSSGGKPQNLVWLG